MSGYRKIDTQYNGLAIPISKDQFKAYLEGRSKIHNGYRKAPQADPNSPKSSNQVHCLKYGRSYFTGTPMCPMDSGGMSA